jgi:hypothetical protein
MFNVTYLASFSVFQHLGVQKCVLWNANVSMKPRNAKMVKYAWFRKQKVLARVRSKTIHTRPWIISCRVEVACVGTQTHRDDL